MPFRRVSEWMPCRWMGLRTEDASCLVEKPASALARLFIRFSSRADHKIISY